jgi:hypothetical protein
MYVYIYTYIYIYIYLHVPMYVGVSKSFPTESVKKYTFTFGITRCCHLHSVMAAKLIRLTHKIAVQLHLVAESCTICSSHARRPVRKLLDTPSYIEGIENVELRRLFVRG